MRVLIFAPHFRRPGGLFYPVGLGYVSASLKTAGHEVKILDVDVHEMSKEESLQAINSLGNYDILASGGLTNSFSFFEWLIPRVKQANPKMKIILGNSLVSSSPKLFIENIPANFGITGEGERTVVELVDAIENKKDVQKVKGIVSKEGETAPAEPLKNIDDAPWPSWEFWPTIKTYVKRPFHGSGFFRKMNIISSRGCPYSCNFCADILKQFPYRCHSAERTVAEIKFLKKEYGVRFISFSDPLFTGNKNHVFELCDLIIKEKLRIKWYCDSRANLADEEMYKRMHKAGCRWIDHGFESGSNKILTAMNKLATTDQARETIKICRKVGIYPSGTFMAGFWGETQQTAEETISFRKEIDVEFCPTFFATAYPRTALWDWCIKNGRIKDSLSYIRSLGEMLDRPYVNCTDFSEEELIALRNDIDARVRGAYVRNHPAWPARILLRKAYNYYRYYGVKKLLQKTLNTAVHK